MANFDAIMAIFLFSKWPNIEKIIKLSGHTGIICVAAPIPVLAVPARTTGTVFAPNTGPFGQEYTVEGIRKYVKGVEALLGDSALH